MEQHFPGRCAYHGLQSKADAAALAEQLIATPAQARPSRMVYVDDLMATEITSILARTLPQEEIPPAVIMGPTPQLYPYPLRHATYFCYDIDAYISDALKILRNALTAGKSSDTKIIHTYREISSPS